MTLQRMHHPMTASSSSVVGEGGLRERRGTFSDEQKREMAELIEEEELEEQIIEALDG